MFDSFVYLPSEFHLLSFMFGASLGAFLSDSVKTVGRTLIARFSGTSDE